MPIRAAAGPPYHFAVTKVQLSINHRPACKGRVPRQCQDVLEVPAPEEPAIRLPLRPQSGSVWLGGFRLPKVQRASSASNTSASSSIILLAHLQVAAKKLFRRLTGLGAVPLTGLGLGDDQHPSGYEAALDAWLPQMWAAARARWPLPGGVRRPEIEASALAQLGAPRFKVAALASGCLRAASTESVGGETGRLADAVSAAMAFRRVAAQAAGGATVGGSHTAADYGPSRPYIAPVLANRRITTESHFQDVR